MLRKMLTPKWLAFGLVAVAAFATCLALGWWQWTRFLDGDGSFRNLGYTALWPVFGAFSIYLWWRLLADTVQQQATGTPADEAPGERAATRPGDGEARPARRPSWFSGPRLPRVQFTYDPAERVAERVEDESDPDLAAYNRYLASLNANTGAGR